MTTDFDEPQKKQNSGNPNQASGSIMLFMRGLLRWHVDPGDLPYSSKMLVITILILVLLDQLVPWLAPKQIIEILGSNLLEDHNGFIVISIGYTLLYHYIFLSWKKRPERWLQLSMAVIILKDISMLVQLIIFLIINLKILSFSFLIWIAALFSIWLIYCQMKCYAISVNASLGFGFLVLLILGFSSITISQLSTAILYTYLT